MIQGFRNGFVGATGIPTELAIKFVLLFPLKKRNSHCFLLKKRTTQKDSFIANIPYFPTLSLNNAFLLKRIGTPKKVFKKEEKAKVGGRDPQKLNMSSCDRATARVPCYVQKVVYEPESAFVFVAAVKTVRPGIPS